MKVLVGLKRVIDYAVHIRVKPDFSGVVKQNVKMSVNPFDDIAVEEAVRLKEKKFAKEVVCLSVGPKESQETLRTAGLAKGADRAILVQDSSDSLEPLAVAKIFQKIVEKENPSLILLGKQAIDDDSCQTAQILAGLLKWQQATFASKIEIKDDKAEVTREIDGGLETVSVKLPAVISCDLRLNTPRHPPIPAIMKAKSKPFSVMTLDDLGIDTTQRLKVTKVTPPPKKESGGQIVDSVDMLIDKLKNEAKVI